MRTATRRGASITRRQLLLGAVGGLITSACVPAAPTPATEKPATQGQTTAAYPNAYLLVETGWLKAHLNEPKLRIIDVRAPDKYQAGHIPGAVNLQPAELDETGNNVQNVLPPDRIAEVLGRSGVADDSKVVIYDDSKTLWAGRVFWVLDYYGHKDVAVLNGGYPKWAAEDNEITRQVPKVEPGKFAPRPDPLKIADAETVKASIGNGAVALCDVRSPAEYEGKDLRAARGGHVPGARNVNWESNVTSGETPQLKLASELKQIYEAAGVTPNQEVITYCQTGIRAAQTYFTLRLLGYSKVRNYDGSWQEWGNSPGMPVEK